MSKMDSKKLNEKYNKLPEEIRNNEIVNWIFGEFYEYIESYNVMKQEYELNLRSSLREGKRYFDLYQENNKLKKDNEELAVRAENSEYELEVIGEVINSVDNADEINDRILKSMEEDE